MHTDENLPADRSSASAPWQYSLRGLLIFTAIVSVCLAIGVYFAGAMAVIVTFGVIQAATLLAADWLIRPANRRSLAFVTAASWTILGSGLLMIGLREAYKLNTNKTDLAWYSTIGLIIGVRFCFVLATRRWRQLTGQGRRNV